MIEEEVREVFKTKYTRVLVFHFGWILELPRAALTTSQGPDPMDRE